MAEKAKETTLFVVTIYDEKPGVFTERLARAESKRDALARVANVRKATADDVERLLKKPE